MVHNRTFTHEPSNFGLPYWLLSAGVSLLYFQMRVRKIAPKILQLLTEWTETFPYDFRDERMMRSLKELTHRLASGDEVSKLLFLHATNYRHATKKLLVLIWVSNKRLVW